MGVSESRGDKKRFVGLLLSCVLLGTAQMSPDLFKGVIEIINGYYARSEVGSD